MTDHSDAHPRVGLTSPEARQLLDTAPDAMVVVDHDGRIVLANTQTEDLFGHRREDLVGERVEKLIPDRFAGTHVAHRDGYFAEPGVRPMGADLDLWAKRRDGTEFPVEIRLSPLETDEGTLVSASIRDVTDRRRIEELRRWQTDFSTGLIDSLPGVFYLIDSAGRLRQWNTNLEKVTGRSEQEMEGISPLEFFDEADRPRVEAAIREVFEGSGRTVVDASLLSRNGTSREYHFIGHRITLGGEQYLTGLGIDITSIRRTESALEYISGMQRVLVEASRQFIAVGSTPLEELITDVLRRVGSYCDVDRSYLFRFRDNRRLMDNTHEWCAPGISAEIDNLQDLPREAVPRVVELMERHEVAYIPSVADLGPDWAADRAVFEEEDIQSLIVVPIVIGDEVHGFIGFDSVRRQRTWEEEETRMLQVLADLFGAVIQRESDAEALRESEARYRAVVDNIREVVFYSDTEGHWTFLNPAWEEITGYPVEESLGKAFHEFVQPEDRSGSRREFRSLVSGKKRISRSELRYTTRGGDFRWLEVNVRATKDNNGEIIGCAGTMRDVTEQREAERKMLHLAHYDPVTELPNRTLALDRLEQLLKTSHRTGDHVAVLFLDLDHFKKANDTLGHEAGDTLLKEAAARLKRTVREQDTVARFGGDEFLVMLGGLKDAMETQPVTEKLLESFREPFHIQGRELMVTTSVGIAIAPADGRTAQDLLRNADMAMYESKHEGRNTNHYFTEAMNRDVERRLAIEEQLRGAMDRNELSLRFQPLVDLTDGAIIGAEALIRWDNPDLGRVTPDEFIPIAEQSGMIDTMGHYVLEQALIMAADWRRYYPNFYVSVNVSPQQFRDEKLIDHIETALRNAGVSSGALQVEITESVLLSGLTQAGTALDQLTGMGVRIAMDDFGTGYASLSYLRQFPFDTLKIDRSFVGDITTDPRDCELVIASLAMARGLGLTVVAEGVETEAQLALLREQHCNLAQGFLFGVPLPADALTELLRAPAAIDTR